MKSLELFNQQNSAHENLPPNIQSKIHEIENLNGKPFNEILKDQEKKLASLAQVVGVDYDMKVNFGKPGEGSFFRPESDQIPKELQNTIVLDPLIMLENPGVAEFISAHEGSHRAITRSYDKTHPEKNYESVKGRASQVGWAYIHNCLEDGAVNDFVANRFERIGKFMKSNYDKSFSEQNAIMSRPDVDKIIREHGTAPRFVVFGSEIMRRWFTGGTSIDLPSEIENAIKETEKQQDAFYKSIPATFTNEEKVQHLAKIRWDLFEKAIWPKVKEMIDADKLDETLKEQLKKDLEKQLQQNQSNQSEQNEQQGNESENPGNQMSEEQLDKMLDEYGFTEAEKQEMKDKIKEAMKKALENQQSGEQSGNQDQESDSGISLPIDMYDLPENIRKKIQKKFENNPESEQKEMQQKADENLKTIEDKLNEQIEAKTGEQSEKHSDRESKNKSEQQQKEKQDQQQKEIESQKQELREKIEAKLMEGRNEYEKAFVKYGTQAEEMYRYIESLFIKKRHPRWQKFHSQGSRLDMNMVMQFESNPENYVKIWERKTIPEKHDYSFLLLNDLSRSMNSSKRENLLAANAIIIETLETLGIASSAYGYTDSFRNNISEFKSFEDSISDSRPEVTSKLSGLMKEGGGMTPTMSAVLNSSEILKERPKSKNSANFMIVITDGDASDSKQPEDLKKKIDEISSKTDQIIIGVGVGSGISSSKLTAAFGENTVYASNPADLPKKMAGLLIRIFNETQGNSA